jgi:REP element-mobilizing transposase RayT
MGRKIRHLREADRLVEVTCRVIQRRFLLRPSPKLNAIVCGVLARAQKRHGMKVCGFIYLSNHCHLLLRPSSVEQMADFMRDVNYKISKEVGRLHQWEGGIWPRPYTDVQVSDEPEAQIGTLRYLLEQACKEGLVASPKHWPGASSTKSLLSGEPIEGLWIDRTAQYRAWERKGPNPDEHFTSTHRLELSPIPCWEHLSSHQYQARVRALVREIEKGVEGVQVMGTKAICAQDPHDAPTSRPRRTPAPRFRAVEPQVRRALEWAYRLFLIAYRRASEDLRQGKRAEFPDGCFAPGRFMPMRS